MPNRYAAVLATSIIFAGCGREPVPASQVSGQAQGVENQLVIEGSFATFAADESSLTQREAARALIKEVLSETSRFSDIELSQIGGDLKARWPLRFPTGLDYIHYFTVTDGGTSYKGWFYGRPSEKIDNEASAGQTEPVAMQRYILANVAKTTWDGALFRLEDDDGTVVQVTNEGAGFKDLFLYCRQ